MVFKVWNTFFHTRLGPNGCKFAGCLRLLFAFLFVADRLLLTLDVESLMSPKTGLVPLWLGRGDDEIGENMYTIFQLAPESDALLWIVHVVGIVQGVLLLLGIAPRFQLLGVWFNLVSFNHQNQVIWDGEDHMFQAFCLSFFLMPLHRRTVYDGFGLIHDSAKQTDSWPMWPIRLFQIHTCLIFIGTSLAKLDGNAWTSGLAIFFITYSSDFYPGLYNPDFLFNRLGPLKLMAWMALFSELTCWSLVWVPRLRVIVVANMILLHLAIELTMNMHCFEWLAILGWLVFFLQPDLSLNVKRTSFGAGVSNFVIVVFLVWGVAYEMPDVAGYSPASIAPLVERFDSYKYDVQHTMAPWLNPFGIYSRVFDMYDGGYGWTSFSFSADMELSNGTVLEWYSPDWLEMPFLQRKRSMRLMNYYSTLSQNGREELRLNLLRRLATDLEKNNPEGFKRIVFYVNSLVAPSPRPDIGLLEAVKVEPYAQEYPVMSLLPRSTCKDYHEKCAMMAQGTTCSGPIGKVCPRSCSICNNSMYANSDYNWEYHSTEDYAWDEGDYEGSHDNFEENEDEIEQSEKSEEL